MGFLSNRSHFLPFYRYNNHEKTRKAFTREHAKSLLITHFRLVTYKRFEHPPDILSGYDASAPIKSALYCFYFKKNLNASILYGFTSATTMGF